MERDVDVIVIGAGISGLTAAYRLQTLEPSCKVLVLEAKDRVGGRTLTVDLKTANGTDKWDLGGQWVCRNQHHILWLLEELGIETYQQWTTGRKLMQIGGHKIAAYEGTTLPRLSIFSLLDLVNFQYKFENFVKQVPREDPRRASRAEEWDNMTFEEFCNQNTWTYATRDLLKAVVCMISGLRPREVSALHYLHYSSMAGSLENLVEAENGGAQEWKIKGGAQQISELLRDKIGVQNIILSEPVKKIDQSDAASVKVMTDNGKMYRCKYVINATPLHCSVATEYQPHIPLTRQSFAYKCPVGHLFKFLITYKTAFWREKGYSGEIIGNGGKPVREGCDSGPIQMVFDSMTGSNNPALVGFYANSWQWRHVEANERREAVLKHLSEFLGPEAAEPIDFIDKDWTIEPYSGGCPVNVATPGALTYFFDGVRTPHDRIHWAGTESATQWNGYLSGAVQSGMRASEEVLACISHEAKGDGVLEDLDKKLPTPTPSESSVSLLALTSVAVVGLCLAIYWVKKM